MSTKNMARSAVEGGRPGENKFDRRYSHKKRRVRDRSYLSNVLADPDYYDEAIEPSTEHVQPILTDKLGAVYGFLLSRVGRPWSEVFSEVREKFDERSLAGYHVVRGHIVEEVDGSGYGNDALYPRPFYIDDGGIFRLRKNSHADPNPEGRHKGRPKITGPTPKQILQWAKSYVIEEGDNVWWANVKDTIYRLCCTWRQMSIFSQREIPCKRGIPDEDHKVERYPVRSYLHRDQHAVMYLYKAYCAHPVWSKGPTLSKREKEFWRTVDDRYKPLVLAYRYWL